MTNTIEKVYHNGTEYVVKDTTYSAGTGLSLTGTTFANTGVTSVNGNSGAVTVEPGITKIFTLADTSDLTTAQDAYDWYANGGNPIISDGTWYYDLISASASAMRFSSPRAEGQTGTLNSPLCMIQQIEFTLSSGSVTAITRKNFQINVGSTVPTLDQKDRITLVI